MSFLSPIAFVVFALSLPLVLLYFLKVRRRERRVSSLLLWQTVSAIARRLRSSSACSAIRCSSSSSSRCSPSPWPWRDPP